MVNRRTPVLRLLISLLAVAMIVATQGVRAEPMPEGMVGWWYYTGVNTPDQFAADPITACRLSAQNHFSTPLLEMRAMPRTSAPIMECKYSSRITGAKWYAPVSLFCKPGYSPRWPGVCVKRSEAPAPAACSKGSPGSVEANPVQLASGSKVQTETDLVAGRSGFLRVERTYRSLAAARARSRPDSAGRSRSIGILMSIGVSSTANCRAFRVVLATAVRSDSIRAPPACMNLAMTSCRR
jgi:hypothetical protein